MAKTQKKQKKKPKKKPNLKKQADNLWSEIVKIKAGHKCEICGKKEYLNSHHVFSRRNFSVRWDISNGVALCPAHHLFNNFSAHLNPIEFVEWLKQNRGEDWYDSIRLKANETYKPDMESVILVLKAIKGK